MHVYTHTHLLPLLLATLLPPLATKAARPPASKKAILLSQVQTLTLRGHGAKTTHRRLSAIPQLRCTSPKALCQLHDMDVMRCTNDGSSYGGEDVEWSCTASLPEELRLGRTEVICEGYADADDAHVLRGSCGVEYSLVLTETGAARYPHLAKGGGEKDPAGILFSVLLLVVAGYIVWASCCDTGDGRRGTRERGTGDGGRGGGGDDGPGGFGGGGWGPSSHDPPPPYPGTKPPSSSTSSSSSDSQNQRWNPGFWSGLAGGAAAGYMAGNRGQRDRNQRAADGPRQRTSWGGSPAPEPSSYPRSSWRSPDASSSASPSSSQHESTGFGSTRRR